MLLRFKVRYLVLAAGLLAVIAVGLFIFDQNFQKEQLVSQPDNNPRPVNELKNRYLINSIENPRVAGIKINSSSKDILER